MGGMSSRDRTKRHVSPFGSSSSSSSLDRYGCSPSAYPSYPSSQQDPYYTPQDPQAFTSYSYGAEKPPPQMRLERKYSITADDYQSLEQVTEALAREGLESSNLMLGIDFTKSNEWTGARSFNRRSLHHIGNEQNPYEQAISIIGRTLSLFDEDNLIPCFGFGDASTHDQDVFSFYSDERFCNGFEEVLTRYKQIVPGLKLAGPTSFAPIIEMAMTNVEKSGGQYHVLWIIADGQVTRSVDTPHGQLSPQEKKTVDAIVKASAYPLAINLVGVGDGPWDAMREFADNIPSRAFDNFKFVNFTEIMSKNETQSRKETEFALAALMEIPAQYRAIVELGMLGQRTRNGVERVPLPPPQVGNRMVWVPLPPLRINNGMEFVPLPSLLPGTSSSHFNRKRSRSSSIQPCVPLGLRHDTTIASTSGYDASTSYSEYDTVTAECDKPVNKASCSGCTHDDQACPICFTNKKDMAFGCGHQTCCDCGEDLKLCPMCRRSIETRIKLY